MFGWKKRDKKPAATAAIEPSGDDTDWSFDALTAAQRAERRADWPPEEEAAAEQARGFVRPGFATLPEARTALRETYEELAPDGATLDALVDRAWSDRIVEQELWSGAGDFTRLTGVFEALAARGIVARMNFACCQRCGHGEIGGEVDDPRAWRGYTFFHVQDAERLAEEPGRLYLAFGAFDRSDETELAVATDIAEELRAGGLSVEWDGTTTERIQVVDVHWRKPLPTG